MGCIEVNSYTYGQHVTAKTVLTHTYECIYLFPRPLQKKWAKHKAGLQTGGARRGCCHCVLGLQGWPLLLRAPARGLSAPQHRTGWAANTPRWSSASPAEVHLGVLWERGCETSIPCQPWWEWARCNKFSVKGRSRAGASKDESHLCARGCPKALKTTHHAVAGRGSRHEHHRWMERLPLGPACSQHERCHSTLPELGRGYKGLATRVLIHNASVNTFIFLELHQSLESEKTVTPTQNLAQLPHLWLFKSQQIPRTVHSTVLCLERRTPQKKKWNKQRGSSTTKTPKLEDCKGVRGSKHRLGSYHRHSLRSSDFSLLSSREASEEDFAQPGK